MSLCDEIWKSHPIYTNHKSSNFAIVKNIKTKRLIKGYKDTQGYTQLHFRGYPQKESIKIPLHIFVYECFNGVVDSSYYDIDHIDNDKKKESYNHLSNLQKLSREEHNKKTGSTRIKIKEKKNDDKYLIWQIKVKNNIEISRKKYNSMEKLLKDGFNIKFVLKCCNGLINSHMGYKWEHYNFEGEYWASLYDIKYDKCMVSNMGRVNYKGIISYGYVGRNGYKIKSIKDKEYKVHQLICIAFYGNAPTCLHTVDHINHIVDDNSETNLRWATKREQTLNRSNKKKICAYEARTGLYYKTWNSRDEAAKELKIKSPSSISDVCNGKNKSSHGYIFKFVENNEYKNNIEISIEKKKPKKYNYNKILALDIETEELIDMYDNQKIASERLKISSSGINSALNGKFKTFGGFKWKYLS